MTGGEASQHHAVASPLRSLASTPRHGRISRGPASPTSDGSSASQDESDESEGELPLDDQAVAGPSALTRAHLTPQHPGRPQRNRKLPSWLTQDTVVEIPIRSTTPQRGGSRQASEDARQPPSSTNRLKGSTSSTPHKPDGVRKSDSATGITSSPRTPSRRRPASVRQGRKGGSDSDEDGEDRGALPSTPMKASSASTPLQSAASAGLSSTPRSRPRPIKRPKLDGTASTPRRKSRQNVSSADSKRLPPFASASYVRPTSADYYFAAHTSRKRSAAQGPSWISADAHTRKELPALTSKEVAKLSHGGLSQDPMSVTGMSDLALTHFRRQYPTWTSLLFLGNEIFLYGLGSKTAVLEDFARQKAEQGEADVVVARGRTAVRAEDWIEDIEGLLDLTMSGAVAGGIEGRARRIVAQYDERARRSKKFAARIDQGQPPLILLIHGLDSPSMLAPRSRICLNILSASPSIHMMASVTHPNAGLLSNFLGSRAGKTQTWIDCTTLLPMLDDCLLSGAGVRLAGLPRAFDLRAGGGVGGLTGMGSRQNTTARPGADGSAAGMTSAAEMHSMSGASAPLLTSGAALHVLRSVTVKARALFLRLAAELKTAAVAQNSDSFASRSVPYTKLSSLASRNFIATSEPALRALLIEFTSHGLLRLHRNAATTGTTGSADEERVSIGIKDEAEVNEVIDGVKKI